MLRIDDKLSIYSIELYPSKIIIDTISKLTKIHKSAFQYFQITHVPRSESGKIRYSELDKLISIK